MAEKFKLERRNPLPPGKYWQDIFPNQFGAFDTWLAKNRDHLDVLADEWFIAGVEKPATRAEIEANIFLAGKAERRFVLFQVIEPVKWEGPGLPTIATEEIRGSGDTEKPTDVLVPGPELPSVGDAVGKAAFGFGAIIAVGLVIQGLIAKVVGR